MLAACDRGGKEGKGQMRQSLTWTEGSLHPKLKLCRQWAGTIGAAPLSLSGTRLSCNESHEEGEVGGLSKRSAIRSVGQVDQRSHPDTSDTKMQLAVSFKWKSRAVTCVILILVCGSWEP